MRPPETKLTKNVTDGRKRSIHRPLGKTPAGRDWPLWPGKKVAFVMPYTLRVALVPWALCQAHHGIYSASMLAASWSYLTMMNGADPA